MQKKDDKKFLNSSQGWNKYKYAILFFKEIKYPVDNTLLHSSDRWQTIGFYFVIRKMFLNIRLVIEWRQFPGQQDDRNSVFEIR